MLDMHRIADIEQHAAVRRSEVLRAREAPTARRALPVWLSPSRGSSGYCARGDLPHWAAVGPSVVQLPGADLVEVADAHWLGEHRFELRGDLDLEIELSKLRSRLDV